jgi:ribA/ribD-fused uncharacterized protein
MDKIDSFSGKYAFLSNFYKQTFLYRDIEFASSEHAFVFEKDGNKKRFILQCQGVMLKGFDFDEFFWMKPGQAKRLGRKIVLRNNWEIIKIDIMYSILKHKFEIPSLKQALLDTGNAYLEEGNNWNDTFWGVCNGHGKNHLGKTLMRVRDYLDCPIPF